MIKKEWFWMLNQNKEEHCHYSGLPSPMAYENKKTSKMSKELKQSILIVLLGMTVLVGMILIVL